MINLPQMMLVIFSGINPVAVLVLYSNIRKNLNQTEHYLTAALSSFLVFAILSFFLLYGKNLLNFLGIPVYIMELGGGLLLSIHGLLNILANEYLLEIRYYMQKLISMFGMSGNPDMTKLDLNSVLESYKRNSWLGLGFCPLAIPVMVNPASVLITLFLNGQINQTAHSILITMLAISILIFLLLIVSTYLTKHVAQIWWVVANRGAGLFLTTIGLEMLINSIKVIISTIFGLN